MVKKVAVINDLSGAGRCSLTVALPVLSTLGVQAFPLPTAILSNQTGYESYYIYDFTEKMENFTYQWKKMGLKFDGIYVGFIASEKQVDKIIDFINNFKNSDTVLIVDPIMGDDWNFYHNFGTNLRERIIQLAFEADVITPNLTECCILTQTDFGELVEKSKDSDFIDVVAECGKKLLKGNVKQAVITGVKHRGMEDDSDMLYNIIVSKKNVEYVKSRIIGGSYSGTGDLLTSVLCGKIVNGKNAKDAVETAVKFIGAAIEDSFHEKTDRNDGVNFEKYLWMLSER